jgi:prolyl-tRNA synthetase
MPTLQPKENWIKTGRWNSMDDLYKVKDSSDREMALGPTHEEVVVPLMQKFINSYRDFPFSVYQFQNKFRMELRSKSGILRGREFMMKDLYSFHLTESDLDNYYEKVSDSYKKIFNKVGIGDETHKTYASGGSFSKYSHEYQTVTPAGEDTIYICNKCGLAINEEIKGEINACLDCKASDFKKEKAIEVANIFKLNTKFTDPFGFKITNEKGEHKEVLMGCYGLGLSRLMGTIVEVYHDEKGIAWPETVAPYKVYLIAVGDKKEVADKADKLYEELEKANVEVLYDDRNVSVGQKFADADLIGLPVRLVVSEKTGDKIEWKKRSEEKTEILSKVEVFKRLA